MDPRMIPPKVDREVDEEIAHHVEMRVRDLVAEGWSEDDARAEAIRRFGDMDRIKADCRQMGTRRNEVRNRRMWFDEMRQDLRYAFRQVGRARGFTAITVATLAIAIGANTAVFSVVNGVVLKPLPYPDPDDLSMVWMRYLPPSGFDIDKFALSPPEAMDIRDDVEALESVGLFQTGSRALSGDGADAERIRVGFYSAGVIPTLAVRPELGRNFIPAETGADGSAVVILSHGLWTERFGADPSIVGSSILLNGVSTEVVGVMGEGFAFPSDTRAWLPIGFDRTNGGNRASHGVFVVGRRGPDVTQEALDNELAIHAERWEEEFGAHHVAHFPWAQTLHTETVADAPERLKLLMAAVALVLLVACANVANLLLARGERREQEVALRTTLGASGGRITRQLVTESLVLALVGAGLGLLVANGAVRALVAIDPGALPRLGEVTLDGTVLLFTVAVAVLTALLFGIVPAYLAGRRAARGLAGSGGRPSAGGSGRHDVGCWWRAKSASVSSS